MFALNFPIIKISGYELYQPIPLPFYIKGNNAVIIETLIKSIIYHSVKIANYILR